MKEEKEIWKDIKNYKSFYQVSNFGRIKRLSGIQCKKERIISPINNGNDYLSVSLCLNSNSKRFYIHRIVAQEFIPNPENKIEVNHIDGCRTNNKLSNLEWVTRSENHLHRYNILNQKGVNFGKTGKKNWKSKKVGCYNDNGKLINIYYGVMEASRQIKVNESSIRCAIYNGTKCKKMKWKYL